MPSERHLLLRVICLHIYEASARAKAFDARARDIIQLRSGDQSLLMRAGKVGRDLNRFSEHNRPYLKPIRAHAIAHREKFEKFISAAESVDEIRILRLATELVEVTRDLPGVLTACTQLSHSRFESRWLELAASKATRTRRPPAVPK